MPQEGPKFAAQNLAEFALMTVTQLKVANAPAWWIFFFSFMCGIRSRPASQRRLTFKACQGDNRKIEKVKWVCRNLHDKSRCIGKIHFGAALSIAPAF